MSPLFRGIKGQFLLLLFCRQKNRGSEDVSGLRPRQRDSKPGKNCSRSNEDSNRLVLEHFQLGRRGNMIDGCKDLCSTESMGRDWPFAVSMQELGTLNEAGRMRGFFLHQGLNLCNVT